MNCRDIFRGVESRSRENSSWIWELLGDGGKSGKSGELQGGEGSYRSDLKLFRTGNTPASGSRVVRFWLGIRRREEEEGTGCGKAADIFIRSSTGNRIDMERESIMHVPRPNSPLLPRHSSSPSRPLYGLDLTPAIRERDAKCSKSDRFIFVIFFFPWEKVAKNPCKSATTRDCTELIRAIYKLGKQPFNNVSKYSETWVKSM